MEATSDRLGSQSLCPVSSTRTRTCVLYGGRNTISEFSLTSGEPDRYTEPPGSTPRKHIDEKNINPGEWVVGLGYDDSLLLEKRHPERDDLDAVSTDHLFTYCMCPAIW